MNIGMIGLGKLGKCISVAVAYKGHKVFGYDINPAVMQKDSLQCTEFGPYGTGDLTDTLKTADITFCTSITDVLMNSDITFVAIQTPHDPKYSGEYPVTNMRKDFDYRHLKDCMRDISDVLNDEQVFKTVVIISTVLPGTLNREILPHLSSNVKLVYNPAFPAVSTMASDFLNPEFVLIGTHDQEASKQLKEFYTTIHNAPVCEMSILSAELCKVFYNTMITSKIHLANTLMLMCYQTGANFDSINNALKQANQRIISTKYMDGGMPDGGGCHPRDLLAMSYLARGCIESNIYEHLIESREFEIETFIAMIELYNVYPALDIVVLGKSYKPETNVSTGSPAMLLANMLKERDIKFEHFDPYVDGFNNIIVDYSKPKLYFIATKHELFKNFVYPNGSIVIDPFRYIPKCNDYTVIRVGENQ